jgi:predicted cytidylate kinase
MIITITGFPGSGKSTLGRGIAKELNLKHYSAGDLLREIARDRGMTFLELHELMKKDSSVDKELDRRNKELGEKEDGFVIDGRLSWHFIPNSIKIFVKVDLEKAAERVFKDCCQGRAGRQGEYENKSLEKTLENMRRRMEMNQERYRNLYGIDYLDEKNYDLVVDTTNSGIDETRQKVLLKIKQLQKGKG